jgi:hypothetical protein
LPLLLLLWSFEAPSQVGNQRNGRRVPEERAAQVIIGFGGCGISTDPPQAQTPGPWSVPPPIGGFPHADAIKPDH